MNKSAKEYKSKVLECLMNKYQLTFNQAYNMLIGSFLENSLINYPEETVHDDIELTADKIFNDSIK